MATKEEVVRDAMTLPEEERLEVAAALLDSVDGYSKAGLSKAWQDEIERRVRDADAGLEESIPWEVLKERLERARRG